MREYLFRGKRKDNGEWVEGHNIIVVQDGRAFIIPTDTKIDGYREEDGTLFMATFYCECIPETIGQYTGMRDSQRTEEYPDGRMIFEGDILSYIDNDGDVQYISIVFEECAFLIEDSGITDSDLLPSYVCLGLTVAGNIHDNPELLEVHKWLNTQKYSS